MKRFYSFLALILMASGGYLLYKDQEAGAALVGSGVSMMSIQQIEEHKRKDRLNQESENNRLVENKVEELEKQIFELKVNNNHLKNQIEKKNNEISKLKTEKAVLETRLEYTEDPYYMKAKLDNPALPESTLEEYDPPIYHSEESEYNEIETNEDNHD